MIVFLRRIPQETRIEDIIDFIEPVLKGGLFKKSGQIAKIEIMIMKDNSANKLEYHAQVIIEPDMVAERVIAQLNRKPILGKHIAVREFVYRLWQNDRRVNQYGIPSIDERRIKDRRRGKKLEVVNKITTKIGALGKL